ADQVEEQAIPCLFPTFEQRQVEAAVHVLEDEQDGDAKGGGEPRHEHQFPARRDPPGQNHTDEQEKNSGREGGIELVLSAVAGQVREVIQLATRQYLEQIVEVGVFRLHELFDALLHFRVSLDRAVEPLLELKLVVLQGGYQRHQEEQEQSIVEIDPSAGQLGDPGSHWGRGPSPRRGSRIRRGGGRIQGRSKNRAAGDG